MKKLNPGLEKFNNKIYEEFNIHISFSAHSFM